MTELFEEMHIISKQNAIDSGMFGPVFHGSKMMDEIMVNGFNVKYSVPNSGSTANGYHVHSYALGNPPPIHHLGFGIYFTTKKSIAKRYNGGSTKNLHEFYLDIPEDRILVINYTSPQKMMKWWMDNGYNPDPDLINTKDRKEWVRATGNLTRNLRKKYDAIWFKGSQGFMTALDGDQIVVFDVSKIRAVSSKLSSGLEIGSKVRHTQNIPDFKTYYARFGNEHAVDYVEYGQAGGHAIVRKFEDGGISVIKFIPSEKITGVITDIRDISKHAEFHFGNTKSYTVKWSKGGTQMNYYASELQPVNK